MGSDGIRAWAQRRSGVRASTGIVTASGTPPPKKTAWEEPAVIVPGYVLAPAPARAGIQPVNQSTVKAERAETVVISKPDPTSPDRYAELLGRVPDLLPRQPGGVDALRMTARGLEGASYEGWSRDTPYYTKVSDSTAEGDFLSLRSQRDRELASGS